MCSRPAVGNSTAADQPSPARLSARTGRRTATEPSKRADVRRETGSRYASSSVGPRWSTRSVEAPAIGLTAEFPLDASIQHRLLEGLDDIGITLAHRDDIDAFEASRPGWMPTSA